ncbi:MarR family winged helix-turn-helix transcriptional regulator [Deinococcus navajonensis]|uniref:MarR family winged helix-turn-helix transcriptional regulator n=1 Tax=Deinococcus navajonensis TaxID=309884 RepID=A0ABV8XJC3_9DEIO
MIPPDHPSGGKLENLPAEHREAAEELGHAMKQLHRLISSRVMRGMQAELIDLDLSFSQMTALHQLRAGGGITVTELSARTRLSVPAASHLVERLVQRGLAGREENPGNRREKLVRLTPAGLEVLGSMDRNFVTGYVSTFAPLQPATVRAATQTLMALLGELEPQGAGPCESAAPKETP